MSIYDKAMVQSCDVYFYEAARRLGIDPLADVCHDFGLGISPRPADVGGGRGPHSLDGGGRPGARRGLAAG